MTTNFKIVEMDLSVKYLGLSLKNPLIVGSSGLTNSVKKIKEIENSGAGAVVLKSLFEEQILFEADHAGEANSFDYPEALDYIKSYSKTESINTYLKLISDCKKDVKIPIIASINCVSNGEWLSFAKKIEAAGADALEVNVSLLPTSFDKSSEDNEKIYFEVIKQLKKELKIPIALKMSHYSAGLAKLIQTLDWTQDVDAFVLFNRYFMPDLDIENLKITSSPVYSSASDIYTTLRWVAALSGELKSSISASTGIRSGEDMAKQILVGAETTQVVSILYENGISHIETILKDFNSWMERKGFKSISEFKGLMNYKNAKSPETFERIQFMKYYSGIE